MIKVISFIFPGKIRILISCSNKDEDVKLNGIKLRIFHLNNMLSCFRYKTKKALNIIFEHILLFIFS